MFTTDYTKTNYQQKRAEERRQLREEIKPHIVDYLRELGLSDSQVTGRKPFNCLNPDHPDRHPSMIYRTQGHFCECLSCKIRLDIFDLIAIELGTSTTDARVWDECRKRYAPNLDFSFPRRTDGNKPLDWNDEINECSGYQKKQTEPTQAAPIRTATTTEEKKKTDFSLYFGQCSRALATDPAAQSYLASRGISPETAQRFDLGYDRLWRMPNSSDRISPTPRLIIPHTRSSYAARYAGQAPEWTAKYYKVGDTGIYNQTALDGTAPVFVTEGELDAISIAECGGSAVALGSVENVGKFVELLGSSYQDRKGVLFLMLDNDAAGQTATAELRRRLIQKTQELRKSIFELWLNVSYQAHDANELLCTDREQLRSIVQDGIDIAASLL